MSEEKSFLERARYRLIEPNGDDPERASDDKLVEANEDDDDDGGTSARWLTPITAVGRDRLPLPKEKAWAVAFMVSVICTIVSAVWASTRTAPAGGKSQLVEGVLDDPVPFGCVLLALIALAYAVSKRMLRALSTCSKKILQMAFVGFVLASVVVVGWLFSSEAVLCAMFTASVCAGVGHVFVRRGRIAFAAENLQVAAIAVRSMPKVFLWSLCVAAIRACLLVAAGIALAGSIGEIKSVHGHEGIMYRAGDCQTISLMNKASCQCNGYIISEDVECKQSHGVVDTMLVCFWMATMGWGFMVCTNIMTATVARSVALWWSSTEDVEPVWRSCQYVITSSLGTLCKGSAIDGGIELVNEGLQCLPSLLHGLIHQSMLFPLGGGDVSDILQNGGVVAGSLPTGSFNYLVQPLGVVFGLPLMLVKLVSSYVMGYTSVFVGMEGLSFTEGFGRAKDLFRTVGMTVITNDIVVGVGLLFAGLSPVVLSVYATKLCSGNWMLVILLMLAMCAYVVVIVVLLPMVEVVLCAYRAVFVCFVNEPEAFSANHDPQLLIGLRREWQTMQLSIPATRDSHRDVLVEEGGWGV